MKRFSLALSAGCAVSLMAGAALADPPAQVGRIAWVENGVSFLPPGEESWTWASVNFPVTSSESFWTGDTGRTELQVGPIEVSADNESELDVLALDYGQMRLGLPQGSIDLKLWQAPPGGAVISTPAGDVVIDQAGDYRVDVGAPQDDGSYPPVEVTVFDGHASAPGQYGPSDVWPGAAAVIYPGYDPQLQDAQDAAIDDWARWRQSTERWDVQANYSPAVTGYGELASYGDFVQDPSYGQVWYPSGVASDWAPYRYGRWAYVAPWGYTWVDDQPWGFAPFHYGRWAQINGRWGWIAGQPAVQPVYAPALVAFIGVPGLSIGVRVGGGGGGGPGLGWVPLAPEEAYHPPYEVSDSYIRNVNVSNVRTETINRVVINRTINNVTVNNITYRNATAATVVPAAAFSSGRPVQRAAVSVSAATIAGAQSVRPAVVAPPTAAAISGAVHHEGAPPAQGAAPPARLAAVRAAVVAHPLGGNKPPVIAGARLTAPAPRPAGGPARAPIAPAQAKEPAAKPMARSPAAAPAKAAGGAPAAPVRGEPKVKPAPQTPPPPARTEAKAPVVKPALKAAPAAPRAKSADLTLSTPAKTEVNAPVVKPALKAAPAGKPPAVAAPAHAAPGAKPSTPPAKPAPDAKGKDAAKKVKPETAANKPAP